MAQASCSSGPDIRAFVSSSLDFSAMYANHIDRYSTSAIAQPQSELIEKARSLADQCRRTEREASETRKKAIGALQKMKASPVVNIHVKGDEVQVLATLTLVYRAIPAPDGSPSRFCDECIETARKAMRKHQECVQSFENQPFVLMIYIHW